MAPQKRAAKMWRLCWDCAGLHAKTPPSDAYRMRVAVFLFVTGAHESGGWRHARQVGFSLDTLAGAWGYWQTECSSVSDSLRMLDRSAALRRAFNAVAVGEAFDAEKWYRELPPIELMRDIAARPEASCAFARLHLLRYPEPIPARIEAQAKYWGKYYNTRNEPAKNKQWLDAYLAYCRPVFEPG